MPGFKVWNGERRIRKIICASSLEDLKVKGAAKLGVELISSLVLEEDGSEIDDDEALLTVVGKTLLLLQPGEIWEPALVSVVVDENPVPSSSAASTAIFPSQHTQSSTSSSASSAIHSFSDSISISSPIQSLSSGLKIDSADTLQSSSLCSGADMTESEALKDEQFFQRAPLPSFGSVVLPYLRGEKPAVERVWGLIVSQAVDHYCQPGYPELRSQTCYRAIGQKMIAAYPAVASEGKHPWKAFCQSLSQRVRFLRHSNKTKSEEQLDKTSATSSKRKRLSFLPLLDCSRGEVSKEDQEKHVKELQAEWLKGGQKDILHIQQLIYQTGGHRKRLLAESSTGYAQLFAFYPCFKEDAYVFQAFLSRCGQEAKECSKRINVLFDSIWKINKEGLCCEPGESQTDYAVAKESNYLTAIRFLEKRLRCKSSIIEEIKDVADEQIEASLATPRDSPPRLRAVLRNTELCGLFVVGDGVQTIIKDSNLRQGVLVLFGMHYAFDIAYPKQYLQMLLLLQRFLLPSEPLPQQQSLSFRLLCKELDRVQL